MNTKQEHKLCPSCRTIEPATKVVPNNPLHFVLSLLTAGLWLLVWAILLFMSYSDKYECEKCGKTLRKY